MNELLFYKLFLGIFKGWNKDIFGNLNFNNLDSFIKWKLGICMCDCENPITKKQQKDVIKFRETRYGWCDDCIKKWGYNLVDWKNLSKRAKEIGAIY